MRLLASLVHRYVRRRRSRGQSLVEFALILPVFLVFLAGVLDLGRVFYATITMNNAARAGAFQAAKDPASFVPGASCNQSTNKVVCAVQLESNDSQLEIANTDIAMSCNTPGCPEQPNSTVTVTVYGSFKLATPILSSLFGGNSLPMNASATAQILYVPDAAAPGASPSPGTSPSPSPSPDPSPSPGVSPSPSPSPSASPACVQPPNVIGMTPTDAAITLGNEGFHPIGLGDLTTGPKNKVQAQNPDSTQCVAAGSDVTYSYRPN